MITLSLALICWASSAAAQVGEQQPSPAPVFDSPVAGENSFETFPSQDRNVVEQAEIAKQRAEIAKQRADIAKQRADGLLSDQFELQIELQKLQESVGPEHPRIRQIQARIKREQKALLELQKIRKNLLLIKVPDRDPKELAQLLLDLYGQNVHVAVYEPRSSIVLTVTQSLTTSEAQALLAEVAGTAKRLEPASIVMDQAPSVDGFPTDEQDSALDREAKRLASLLRSAQPQDQAGLRKELQAVTEKQFDYRQQRRQQEFDLLTERVERLKSVHARRQKNKTEVIQRRINELLDPDLRWDGSSVGENESLTKSEPPNDSQDATVEKSVPDAVLQPLVPKKAGGAQPTYDGMTLADSLRAMDTERNKEKLATAVMAANHLIDQGDPLEIVQTTLRMMRVQGTQTFGSPADIRISGGAVVLLEDLPSDIVVAALIGEMSSANLRQPMREFFSYFISSIARTDGTPANPQPSFETRSWLRSRIATESTQRLRQEIRRQSRRLISLLVNNARQNVSQTDRVLSDARQVLQISNQRITAYPDLLILAEREFANSETGPSYELPVNVQLAALLLGESGLLIPDLFAFAQKQLQEDKSYSAGIDLFAAIAPWSPEAVNFLHQSLRDDWAAFLTTNNENASVQDDLDRLLRQKPQNQEVDSSIASEVGQLKELRRKTNDRTNLLKRHFFLLVRTLGNIGAPAKTSIPLLRKLVESDDAVFNNSERETWYGMGVAIDHRTLQQWASDAIKQIDESKPKPEPKPLPEDNGTESPRVK